MDWKFDNNRPIYLQIIEQIQLMIISGKYQPGAKLASVRELAFEAKVNPNTMQKALSELERNSFVFANRTAGRFITDDINKISELKKDLAKSKVKDFFCDMSRIGFSSSETVDMVVNFNEGGSNDE